MPALSEFYEEERVKRPVKERIAWVATFIALGFAALYVASFVLSGHGRELMNVTAGFLFGLAYTEVLL